MDKLRFYVMVFLVFAALLLSCRYWGDFNWNQGFLVAFLGTVGWDLYRSIRVSLQAERGFSPFWIRVSPHWHCLLRDFGLICDDETEFWDNVDPNPADYNVLRDDIVFTLLKRDPIDGLIYWNSHRMFRSEVDLEERIADVKIERRTARSGYWSPDIYFKWSARGYELGLKVDSEWWKEMCATDETRRLAKIGADSEYLTGRTRLTVAVLPYSEFNIYQEGNSASGIRWWQKKEEKNREAQAAKAGWAREEMVAEIEFLGAPTRIEHKYFTVEHTQI